jgi:acetyl esterase
MLDGQFKAILDAAKLAAAPALETLPINVARAVYKNMRKDNPADYPELDVRDLPVAGGAGEIMARLYAPKGVAAPGPGLVYFHGGGFVLGDLDTLGTFCRRLAWLSGVRVLSVDYRLAPEARFPAAHDDALAATLWAFAHADEIGFDPKRIAVGGDSAGGNLAASVAISLSDGVGPKLAWQMLLYPVVQFTGDSPSLEALGEGFFLTRRGMDWFNGCLFGDTGLQDDPRVAVIHAPDVAATPPAYVRTAGYDPLKDQGRAYADKLRAAGVTVDFHEYPRFIHGFYSMSKVAPVVLPAIAEAAEALKAALA